MASPLVKSFLVAVSVTWKMAAALDPSQGNGLRGLAKSAGPDESISLKEDASIMWLKSPFGQAFGIALGTAMMGFAARSIRRTKDEQKRIQKMFDENTSAAQLQKIADTGAALPSLVIIRGVASADGADVPAVSPGIEGLKSAVGRIDQPENAFIKIAQMAKSDPEGFKPLTDKVQKATGIAPSDIPTVTDDYSHTTADFKSGTPLVLSEILVARLCVYVSKTKGNKGNKDDKDDKTEDKDDKDLLVKKITITRTCRNQSYACFYGRKVSDGFHLLDMQGGRLELKLPEADRLPQFSSIHHGEAPSLFLPTANVDEEFFSFLRKEDLTVQGKHLDFSNMPQSKLTEPDTLLSKFICVDAQSSTDLGSINGNSHVLQGISKAYGGAPMLWEPRGFYDKDNNGDDGLPSWAPGSDSQAQMVSADELIERGSRAAELNSQNTIYCEPTFSRGELRGRRDQENCFRVTELAIPRGCDVTILAKPVKNAQGKVMLVPPNSAEDGADPDSPDAQRFRFRFLKGHTVENLLKQRDLNIVTYYGFALVGAFITVWAADDYPGL